MIIFIGVMLIMKVTTLLVHIIIITTIMMKISRGEVQVNQHHHQVDWMLGLNSENYAMMQSLTLPSINLNI